MPNIKSAKKRMVLSEQAREKNRGERSRLRTALKQAREATEGKDAEAKTREAVALLDQAAQERIVHPNKAARLKSQLARHVNQLTAKKQ
jgi:small subunit ribosomal protein S20